MYLTGRIHGACTVNSGCMRQAADAGFMYRGTPLATKLNRLQWVFAHTLANDEPHELNAAFTLDRFMTGALIDEHGAAGVAH